MERVLAEAVGKLPQRGNVMRFLVLCLTSLGSFGALFLIAKLIGHKQIAQLDFF